MKKRKIFSIVIGFAVFVVAFVIASDQPKNKQFNNKALQANASTLAETTKNTVLVDKTFFSLVQIASHNNASSCWSAINGGVYDLTTWISQHPGGEGTIVSICGNDGSLAFNDQHYGKKKIEKILETFKIGLLTQ